ncbi:MAG: TetR/AcrR family transcriptional regulator [Candidatus Omnitrophota bacterium]
MNNIKEMNPVPRKLRDKLLRRSDILEAAIRVFAEKGYHEATMLDIARQAEYAVGTIYLYFKDKQSLYLALIDEKTEGFIRSTESKIDKTQEVLDKIKVLVEEELLYFEENRDFFKIYFSEGGIDNWTIKDKPHISTINKLVKFMDYVAGIMKAGQDKGIIKDDLEPKKAAYLLMSLIKANTLPWFKESQVKEGGLRGQTAAILDIFLRGVSAR